MSKRVIESNSRLSIQGLGRGLEPARVFIQYVYNCLTEHGITTFTVEYVRIHVDTPDVYESTIVIDGHEHKVAVYKDDVHNNAYGVLWQQLEDAIP